MAFKLGVVPLMCQIEVQRFSCFLVRRTWKTLHFYLDTSTRVVNKYPQTTQTLCACQQTHAAINILILKTTARMVLLNLLIFNGLQNVNFGLTKQSVFQSKTGHIAVWTGSFQNVKRHIRKIKTAEAVSSCISASVGRLRIFIYTDLCKSPFSLRNILIFSSAFWVLQRSHIIRC